MKQKRLESWNILKIKLDMKDRVFHPKKRDIWLAHLGINVGHEQDGSGDYFQRPVVILKRLNFQTFVVIPLTSRKKTGSFYFPLYTSQKKQSIAILAQIRVLDQKRFIRKVGVVPKEKFQKLTKRIGTFLTEDASGPEGKVNVTEATL